MIKHKVPEWDATYTYQHRDLVQMNNKFYLFEEDKNMKTQKVTIKRFFRKDITIESKRFVSNIGNCPEESLIFDGGRWVVYHEVKNGS